MEDRTFQARPPTRGLKRKLVLSMLLVGLIPLIIGLTMAFLKGTKEIREVNGASFQVLAVETARKLDLVLSEEVAKTRRISNNLTIIQALETRRDKLEDLEPSKIQSLVAAEKKKWENQDPGLFQAISQGPLAQILRRNSRGSYREPGQSSSVVRRSATRGLFITDIAGRLVASLDTDIEYVHKKTPWWQGAYNQGIGKPYLGNVSGDPRRKTHAFTLSLPIMDSLRYNAIGVIHRIYDAQEFFGPSIETIRFGETGHVMLIDGNGVVISCPILPSGTRLADTSLVQLVTPNHFGWVSAPHDGHSEVETSLIGWNSLIGHAPLPDASRITQDSTDIGWHTFVWQSSAELYSPIKNLFTTITLFGAIAVGLLITLGLIVATRIVNPVRHLQDAAKLIGKGEHPEPIVIKTGDEIEDLAEEINRMNQKLQETFGGLRSEVASKAQEVQYLQESTIHILNAVPIPVLMLDSGERVQYLNQASKDAFLNGGSYEGNDFFSLISVKEMGQQKLRREIQQLSQDSEDPTSQKSAKIVSDVDRVRDPLSPLAFSDEKQEKREIEINNRIYRYDWFTINSPPGKKEKRIGMVLRETTDESRLQDQLTQHEKSTSLGILSAGISHELNNPLVGVIGFGEAILDEEITDQIKEYAQSIVDRGRKMSSIIQDFTGQVLGQTKGCLSSVDLNEQLTHALKYVQLTGPASTHTLDIQTHLQPVPTIQGQPEEIRQAFINILANSVHALQGKGSLSLATDSTDSAIIITIQDSGSGIPSFHLSKIFDPFFTTKRQGEGSGLGLTIVRKIIQRYGGEITIESEEGKGTKCVITFPKEPSLNPEKEPS